MPKSFSNRGATVVDTVADLPAASAALEGVMVFQKDTNELKICDGSNWISVVDTDAPTGLVLTKSVSFANSTSINVDGCFNANYKDYRVIMTGYSNSSGGADLFFKYRSAGVTTTGTNYTRLAIYSVYNGSPATSYTANINNIAIGAWGDYTTQTTTFDAANPFWSGYAKSLSFQAMSIGNSNTYIWSGAGWCTLSNSFDGFNISCASSLWGDIRVYGYRNSI